MVRWMIDPPGGWRYGFPKEIPAPLLFNTYEPHGVRDWLFDNGYPKHEWDNGGDRYRTWQQKE